MRRILLGLVFLALLMPSPARAGNVLLNVDDGDLFYTVNPGACSADTDVAAGAQARRHWHVGLPLLPGSLEPAGGFGCLGGPMTFGPVTVQGTASVVGSIRYTWDTNVPGGCCNDVQLHVYDAAGNIVASTLFTEGPKPVIPMVAQPQVHVFDFTLPAGTYTFAEDIFSGEHTAWLTKLTVTDSV